MKGRKIRLRMPVVKECPFREETDIGRLRIIVYGADAPELHALAARIEDLAVKPGGISHEDYTAAVAALCPAGSKVTSWWRTGPWEIRVDEIAPGPAEASPP
jgi:hypothetical protein